MSKAVLNLVLGADYKQISTESLSHVTAALNILIRLGSSSETTGMWTTA
jgi:hypothetical protein